jgi:hypothetical protein
VAEWSIAGDCKSLITPVGSNPTSSICKTGYKRTGILQLTKNTHFIQ